jgi:hypothetical protein
MDPKHLNIERHCCVQSINGHDLKANIENLPWNSAFDFVLCTRIRSVERNGLPIKTFSASSLAIFPLRFLAFLVTFASLLRKATWPEINGAIYNRYLEAQRSSGFVRKSSSSCWSSAEAISIRYHSQTAYKVSLSSWLNPMMLQTLMRSLNARCAWTL